MLGNRDRAPILLVALMALSAGSCAPDVEPASLVLRGGKVLTLDESFTVASAVAISGHRIVEAGSDEAIDRYIGPDTEVIDLRGRLVIPGFIEGHGHFLGLGRSRTILDLRDSRSWDDIVERVRAVAAESEPGQWILGRGWHQEKWTRVPEGSVDGVPLHRDLSAVSPDNPVILTHASGHAALVNARALDLGGIGADTPDPPGGEIVRDATGAPTGMLREAAQRLVSAARDRERATMTGEERAAEWRLWTELAGREALAHGVTTFHDAGSSFEEIDFFRRLDTEGELPVRLHVMVRRESNESMAASLPRYRILPEDNGYLTVRSIKRQVDGALGTHGAWLLEPYVDLETSTGLNLEPIEDIEETARLAIENGFQLNTHAIGDRANREVLDIYEKTFDAHPEKGDLRWRIEHAQHLHPDDIERFADLGVIASVQGIHCASDGPWVPMRLGERRAEEGAYVWRKLIDSGATVINGTDVPVEPIDPIAGFHASVTRITANGEAFYPEQRMTRQEALRSYTIDAAYAGFDEGRLGSIEPGKLADLAVLSNDIMTIPDSSIRDARVDVTILGGIVRYRQGDAPAGR